MSDSEKSLLRARCRALRDAMTSAQVTLASVCICEHLAVWPIFLQARTVMAYIAFGNEASLMPLMSEFDDKRWMIPRIVKTPEPQLVLHPYDPARLVRHPFGMLEPDASLPVIEPRELDLALVPGVVFDRRGYRLGFGAGFYDRFMLRVTAIKVGITYAALIADQIPNDSHDQRVDYVASEMGVDQSIGDR